MKLHGAILPVFLLSLLLPASSPAQQRRLEVTGFFGGLSITHDLGTVDNIYFSATGAAENVSFPKYLGVRAAFFFSPFIGVEGNLSRGNSTYTLSVDDNELGTVDLGEQFEVKQLNYGGALIVQYPLQNGLAPYGIAGLGRESNKPTNPIAEVDSVTGFDITFGGGVKYFFEGVNLGWLGVRFDFRYHVLSDGLAFEGNEASPRQTEFSFGAVLSPF